MKLLGSLILLVLCFTFLPQRVTAQAPAASPAPMAAQSAPAAQTTQYTLPPDKLANLVAKRRDAVEKIVIDMVPVAAINLDVP